MQKQQKQSKNNEQNEELDIMNNFPLSTIALKIEDLPSRPKQLDEGELENVLGGNRYLRYAKWFRRRESRHKSLAAIAGRGAAKYEALGNRWKNRHKRRRKRKSKSSGSSS